MMSCKTTLLLLLLAAPLQIHAQGVSIKSCSGQNASMQVEEERGRDLALACQGLDMTANTTWTYRGRHPMDIPQNIATCFRSSASAYTCSPGYNIMILASINEHTARSYVIIPDIIRGRFPDGTWGCHNGGHSVQCDLNVIYAPKDAQCHVTVDETSGMVSGECQTSKMYSSLGKYACQWFEGNNGAAETTVDAADTEFNLTQCDDTLEYMCGNCSFSKSLPSASHSYRYRVLLSPGDVSPPVTYTVVTSAGTTSSSLAQATVPPVTSSLHVTSQTSAQHVAAQTTGSNVQRTSGGVVIMVVDHVLITQARYEGIGIGVAGIIFFLVVLIIIFLVRRARKNKKKDPAEDLPSTVHNQQYGSHMSPPSMELNPVYPSHGLPPPTVADTSFGIPPTTHGEAIACEPPSKIPPRPESDYCTIGGPSDFPYLTPLTCGIPQKSQLGHVEGSKGGNQLRGLPSLQAKAKRKSDRKRFPLLSVAPSATCVDNTQEVVGGSDVSADSQDGEASKDVLYMRHISVNVELPLEGAHSASEPPFCEDGGFPQSRALPERRAVEEVENAQNEGAEMAASSDFTSSGFQMKGADYIYMRNAGIPPSEPI